MKPNTLQRILMNTYQNGVFAHLKRDEDLRECGDLAFKAMYYELDDDCILEAKARGIDPALLATQRLNTMLSDIGLVIGQVSAGVQLVPPTMLAELTH